MKLEEHKDQVISTYPGSVVRRALTSHPARTARVKGNDGVGRKRRATQNGYINGNNLLPPHSAIPLFFRRAGVGRAWRHIHCASSTEG